MQSSATATLLDLVQGVSGGFRTLATTRHRQERLLHTRRTCSEPTLLD